MSVVLALTILLAPLGGVTTIERQDPETTTTTGFGVPTDDGEGRRIDGDVVVGGDGVQLNTTPERDGFDTPIPLAVIFLGVGVVVLGGIGIVIRRFGEA